MHILVVWYSRTGTTQTIGQAIAGKLGADSEAIQDTVDRGGAMGYVRSGRDAMQRTLTQLQPVRHDPAHYDLVVIGTPIWGWNMSVPIRTYLTDHQHAFSKQVAFFCTMGGSGDEKAFTEMATIINNQPIATLAIKTVDVAKEQFTGALEGFIASLQSNGSARTD